MAGLKSPLKDAAHPDRVSGGANIALRTAESIELDIVDKRSPVGSVLSERELMRQYGVGRPALREAIRILQCRGFITMRPGPNGGFISSLPSIQQTSLPLSARLLLLGVTDHNVREMRVVLSVTAVKLILEHSQYSGALLDTLFDRSAERHAEEFLDFALAPNLPVRLASLCENSALLLFAQTVASFIAAPESATDKEQRLSVTACEDAIIAALEARDTDTACRQLSRYHEQFDHTLNLYGRDQTANASVGARLLTHQATRLARDIVLTLLNKGYAEGDRLGSEDELCARYRASPETIRQALRILEADGLIRLRPGRGLGVFVKTPQQASMISGLCRYLRGNGFTQDDAYELTRLLCIELCLRSTDGDCANCHKLPGFLTARATDEAMFAEMSSWLDQAAAHNPILRLLAVVLADWQNRKPPDCIHLTTPT